MFPDKSQGAKEVFEKRISKGPSFFLDDEYGM